MCMIKIFLLVSVVIEVGQASLNMVSRACFAVDYLPLF